MPNADLTPGPTTSRDQPAFRIPAYAGRLLPPMLVFVFVVLAYTTTLAPGVLGGDAAELQFVPYVLGLTHPTGYPLQTLLDKLWVSVVSLGTVAWRTNLLSALTAATGVAIVWALIRRSTGSWLSASAAALLLAIVPVYWDQAVLGDKYALNGLLTALLLAAAYRFYRRPDELVSWAWLAFAAGLSLTHHRSFLAFGPALALLVLICGWRAIRKGRALLVGATCLVVPLLLYLYVPLASQRYLPPFQSPIDSVREFTAYMQDAGFLEQVGLLPQMASVSSYAQTLLANFGWLPLALGLVAGVVALVRRKERGWLMFLLGCFLLQAYFTQNYTVPRQFVFYIPAYVCLSTLLGTAIAPTTARGDGPAAPARASGPTPAWRNLLSLVPALLLLAVIIVRVAPQWRLQREEQAVEAPLDPFRQDMKVGGRGDRMAASLWLAPSRSLVSADWEQATSLWYAQQVEGACPDCLILSQIEGALHQHSEKAAREGRPFLIARAVSGASDWSAPTAVGALVQLEGRPSDTVPADLKQLAITFAGKVKLLGYRWPLGPALPERGKVLPLSFAWQLVSPSPDYSVSFRLMSGDKIVWLADATAPVLGMQPFSKMTPGQVIQDYYEVPIAPDAPPGRYTLNLLLYQSENGTFTNAAATSDTGESVGTTIQVLAFDLK